MTDVLLRWFQPALTVSQRGALIPALGSAPAFPAKLACEPEFEPGILEERY